MPTKNHITSREIEELEAHAGGTRSEPEGRAELAAGAAAAVEGPPLPGLPGAGRSSAPSPRTS
jgi:hypothetical protein